ncbi:MAG: HAD domain-containing protein [Propionicimonas sp.]|uniref:HAD domain-containing protein n=1 Tax=Propionicimonas sp. TaxID=1955623 RepID=UPI003D1403A7
MLLLDVDGVINSYPGPGNGARSGVEVYRPRDEDGVEWTVWVEPEVRGWLAELADTFGIVWCTTWRNANEAISPLVGLPTDLPQILLPVRGRGEPFWFCWKTPQVRRWAAGTRVTRFAWIDDEVSDADVDALSEPWLAGRLPGKRWEWTIQHTPAIRRDDLMLVRTRPQVGMTERQVGDLLEWGRHG